MQEVVLAEGYTSGQWANPGFGALIAKNLTTWKDKQEVEQNVNANVKQEIKVEAKVELDFSDVIPPEETTE